MKRLATTYICDRKQCENCSAPEYCTHTTSVLHAKNFSEILDKDGYRIVSTSGEPIEFRTITARDSYYYEEVEHGEGIRKEVL